MNRGRWVVAITEKEFGRRADGTVVPRFELAATTA